MLALPTEQQVIEAFQKQKLRPSGNVFSAWTGSGVRCSCALTAFAAEQGHQISNLQEAVTLFGPTAKNFMSGWDRPDYLFHVEYDGILFHNPIGEQGARCWWACVEAGLVPNHFEIPNSDLACAPSWWHNVKYEGPVSIRFADSRNL